LSHHTTVITVNWTPVLLFADCLGYIILDSVQSHHDMGVINLVLCSGLFLQLCCRWPVCWLS